MATSKSSETVTVGMPDEMVDAIDVRLDYGDSRAAWIRAAVAERLERERGREE